MNVSIAAFSSFVDVTMRKVPLPSESRLSLSGDRSLLRRSDSSGIARLSALEAEVAPQTRTGKVLMLSQLSRACGVAVQRRIVLPERPSAIFPVPAGSG